VGEFLFVIRIFVIAKVFLELHVKRPTVCPMYFILQSGQVGILRMYQTFPDWDFVLWIVIFQLYFVL
jgi:hypothetical protein